MSRLETTSSRARRAMTAALAGTLSFSLYLIVAFNGPFDGSTRVSPLPYEVELQHVSMR